MSFLPFMPRAALCLVLFPSHCAPYLQYSLPLNLNTWTRLDFHPAIFFLPPQLPHFDPEANIDSAVSRFTHSFLYCAEVGERPDAESRNKPGKEHAT